MSDSISIDARGLSCPEPVIMTKQAMKRIGQGRVETLVDSGASLDNVKRAAELVGWSVEVEEISGREFRLVITK